MADTARGDIAQFVQQGNLRVVTPSPDQQMAPQRASELQSRLANLREATAPIPPADTTDVADFRAAVQEREAQAQQIKVMGKDVPRWNANNPVMSGIYKAHDTVASLPVPTGLGLLIAVVVLFFFILVPATSAGETRALLLWDVLLGKKIVASEIAVGGKGLGGKPVKGWNPGTTSTSTSTPTSADATISNVPDVQLGLPGHTE